MAHYELRRHHSEICRILDASDASLLSLAVSLYSDGIIDESTKHSVMRTKGIKGADELMSAVTKVVEKDPSKYLGTVLDIMEKVKVLENVSQSIRECDSSTGTGTGEEEEIMSSSEASPVVYKSVDELYTEAVNLRDKFQELLEKLNQPLKDVDNDRLKLKLNWHLTCEREITAEVKDILKEIDEISSPSNILYCLIRSYLIGYLNYRLLDVFQGLINDTEVDEMITKYEEAHEIFLKSSDLETLAQLFLDHPTLAPETFAGLPRFTVHLDKEWEKKSVYQWSQLLKTRFNQWPPHIYIVMITKKCIIIEYSVLPCNATDIVRDLSDSQVLSTHGVTEIELSEQLREMGETVIVMSMKVCHEKGLEPSDVTKMNTSLLEAVKHGADTATVSTLLKEGADIHTTDGVGDTPLHHAAAEKGKKETVELLLNKGATKDIKTKNWVYHSFVIIQFESQLGCTPLHRAAEYGHDSIIEILIQYGATVDEKKDGYTPLHLAARQGRKTTVELLLKYKANYSIQSDYGDTMLHSAVNGGNTEIVELFLKLCGTSDLNKVDSNGYTPLHCAIHRGHTETVELLLKSGANVDGMKECHLTPLHVAVDKNHVDIAELLLKAGANVRSKDRNGRTPLHHAAQGGHERIVELLLKYGAKINKKDKYGFTPLHLVVKAKDKYNDDPSHENTVRILVSNGAEISIKDNKGHTPLYYAEGRHKVIEEILSSESPKQIHQRRAWWSKKVTTQHQFTSRSIPSEFTRQRRISRTSSEAS